MPKSETFAKTLYRLKLFFIIIEYLKLNNLQILLLLILILKYKNLCILKLTIIIFSDFFHFILKNKIQYLYSKQYLDYMFEI